MPNAAGSACVCGSRFSAFSAHHLAHARLELVADRFAEPRVQPADLTDRVGLHGAEVDVEEPVVGPAVAELHRPVHADRPVVDVQLAQIAPVEVVGETACDVGVYVGDGQDHVGRIAMGHHEAGIGEHPVQLVQRQHMRG